MLSLEIFIYLSEQSFIYVINIGSEFIFFSSVAMSNIDTSDFEVLNF